MIRHEFIFWGLFLVFNYLQFLPNYIFNFHNSSFLPYLDKLKGKKAGFFESTNMDFFRYLIDVSFLILILKFRLFELPLYVVSAYYLFLFIFNFYHNVFLTIYQVYPSLYNDRSLIKTGLAILWRESKVKTVISFIVGIAVLYLIYYGFSKFLVYTIQFKATIFDIVTGSLFVLISIYVINRFYVRLGNKILYAEKRMRFVIGFARVIYNIKLSKQLFRKEQIFKKFKRNKLRSCSNFDLKKHPNLFFLFIESYGSILLNHPKMRDRYKEMYNVNESSLKNLGWHMVSNLSEAPSTSAFSWLCYSSFFHGYRISQHAHYERFLRNPIFYNSDNLMRILKNQGYTTYFLNPIQPNPRIKIDYTYLTPFYSIDQWILYDDLDYTGNRYGFGDFPPDQFSINRGREIVDKNPGPFAFMFLTKNSHSPFSFPLELVEDWRSLNKSSGRSDYGGGFLSQPTMSDYLSAIQYQLDLISDFIINTGNSDDIYIVIGDHQPPVLNDSNKYGLNTPVHIITKNESFLKGFEDYGFRDSPFDNNLKTVRHEAMYSIILRELMKNFGTGYDKLPEYEPKGLQI
jgi:hypothetical protein